MTIRVQPVPSAHPYVRSLRGPGVSFLRDPAVAGRPDGQWWPHAALEPHWVREHADRFDLLHVHFGTEHRSTAEIDGLLETLRDLDKPLVYTAHDIQHPHLADPEAHAEQLGQLVRGAAAVLTLTHGAADELRRRYGVEAIVAAHPQLAPDAWFSRADRIRGERPEPGRNGTGPRVGVHLRGARPNVRPTSWLSTLARAVASVGGTLHVFVNDDAAAVHGVVGLRSGLGGRPGVELHVRPRADDDTLAAELASLDVAVLPYLHGSHSGWLELCWDLGVRVLGPSVGYFAEQHTDPWFYAEHGEQLASALARLVAAGPVPGAAERLAERRAQLESLRQAHRSVYETALSVVRS